jgi:hypothetical protein
MNKADQISLEAINMLRSGQDGDPLYVKCRDLYMQIYHDPSCLKSIDYPRAVGQALSMLPSFGTIDDIDVLQRIASVSYFLASKAIHNNPNDRNSHKDRLFTIMNNKEAFGYTVAYVVEDVDDWMSMRYHPFRKRDAIVKMEMYDFSIGGDALIQMNKVFTDEFMSLMRNIKGGMLGDNADIDKIIDEGKKIHEDLYKYLENRILVEEDLDF